MPFLAIQLAVLLLVTYLPDIFLWFPKLLGVLE
jgi:TRAP-type C4-dicarboxylate transport system permease large subunit